MASLQQRSGWFHLLFRYQGRQYSHALKTKDRREAEAHRGTVDRLLIRIRNKEMMPPPATVDIAEFFLAGGKVPEVAEPLPVVVTLKELGERYLAAHSNGALEEVTLETIRRHLKRFTSSLGEQFAVRELTVRRLQEYLETRNRVSGKEVKLSPETLRKEIASLRVAWNWGVRTELLAAAFPGRGLTYPKSDEKPPFQTREDIQRKIARGGLTDAEVKQLWACWFFTKPDLAEFLAFAKSYHGAPFVYPMVAFAGHTGARRSELIRLRIDDLDLDANRALIRENKRVRGQRSTRRVPISGFLKGVLTDWLAQHPGGQHLFCQRPSDGSPTVPLEWDDARNHFTSLVKGTPWKKMRGWHMLRHSFISICASEGVDQRVLQGWVGHLSAATHKRYTHLIPSKEQEIIGRVFG